MGDSPREHPWRPRWDNGEHLLKAQMHAQQAKNKFDDGSKAKSVADNVVRWAGTSVDIVDRYLRADTDQGDDE